MDARRLLPPFLLILLVAALVSLLALRTSPSGRRPGPLDGGATLLPNGWRIAPAGQHLAAGDLPLAMIATADGRHLLISNNGYAAPSITVVDLHRFAVVSRTRLDSAWLGLAFHPDGSRLYSSGAAQNVVHELAWTPAAAQVRRRIVLAPPERRTANRTVENPGFIGGIAVGRDGSVLYAAHVFGTAVSLVDLSRGEVQKTVPVAAEPYAVLLSRDGRTLFVSLWGGAKVLMLDAATLESRGEVQVGEHPNAMALSRDGGRLFVACANTNAVWVVDVAARRPIEQISVALYPDAPPGTTPNAVDVSPDGTRLAVANADNNTVALVDIAEAGASRVAGWLPVGWYPTGVLWSRDGAQLYVLSGKGLTPKPNPRGSVAGTDDREQYIARLLTGTLSRIPVPDGPTLRRYSRQVYRLTPYSDVRRLAPSNAPASSPIPGRVGDPSPIRYVFYVIRENRTYDQVLGDLPEGNGDPTLTSFGEAVTPNAHALAREFVLLDNFYVDAEVSYDGHAFSTGAIATDVIEKIWPTSYGGRGGPYLSEGGGPVRNPYGNIAAPPQGYLWDFAKRAGVSVRSYGEFARRDDAGVTVATVPGLQGLVAPAFAPWDLKISDLDRFAAWLAEFSEYERNGTLPRLNIIRLPNDHTAGTTPGRLTPRAYVAENDLALGRLVESISRSRYWKESAILVLEDDAQNGSDHVDAHRAPAFVISPFAKRSVVDSTLYTTSGMLRTIELILGLPPMTQYDAAAQPMYGSFQATADPTPYTARAARVPLDEKNGAGAVGAQASARMDFSEADRTPELELNEIIWKSIHGADSPMPPPVRAAFVRAIEESEDR